MKVYRLNDDMYVRGNVHDVLGYVCDAQILAKCYPYRVKVRWYQTFHWGWVIFLVLLVYIIC